MRHLIPFIATIVVFLSTTTSFADLGDQLFKILPNDGITDGEFGISVALGGGIAIVGVWGDDDNGAGSGSAYLFDVTTGKAIAKLLPKDGHEFDYFGESVAINNTPGNVVAIVGNLADDDNGYNSGAAYLFDTTTGQQITKLLPNDGIEFGYFGGSVAISDSLAIIGAAGDDDNGFYSGSAYIFDISTGQQIAKILPTDGSSSDGFGSSVAISDCTVVIGARHDSDYGEHSGSAYIFDISDPTNPVQTAKLLPNDGDANDLFGIAVAIHGNTAVIGASGNDDNGSSSGSAYLFDSSTGKQIAKLLPSDGAAIDHFGLFVDINSSTVIIGAVQHSDSGYWSGSAYLFDAKTGQQLLKLLPNDGEEGDLFGVVAISSTPDMEVALVGAFRDDNINGNNSGSAYLFDATVGSINCPWDLDKSGSVNTSDLLEIFAQWGTDGKADFNKDGFVDERDLLILLANWGLCK